MFEKITSWFKGAINKMMKKETIQKKLRTEVVVSEPMANSIALWTKIYTNSAPWLNADIKSLRLGAAIAAEFARLATIEFKSEITGSKRAEVLNEYYKKLKKDLRKNTEYGLAKGGLIIRPYIDNAEIIFDYVQADAFYITSSDSSGNITGIITQDELTKGKTTYYRLEHRSFENNAETIRNLAYYSTNGAEPVETSLKSVPEWSELEPIIVIENIKKPLFAYFKTPMANEIEPNSPLGVSIFSRATELIEQADKQYWRFIWENESGERALNIDISALATGSNGEKIVPHKRLYKTLDTGEQDFYQEWSPQLRNDDLLKAFDSILKRIEFNTGLAYGTISDPQSVDKTATEVKQSRQRSYATVSDIQQALQDALEHAIYAADILATLYNLAPQGAYQMSFQFDDSIIADRETEFNEKLLLKREGILRDEEFRAWYTGETLDKAKENLPKLETINFEA